MRDAPFVKIAKALADPTRHRMLRELRAKGELTCSGVCECFDLSQPTISHHIKTLEEAGLITVRRRGQFHVLTANEETLAAFASDLIPNGRPRRARKAPSRSRS
jgi:DNA-binding transcriptional ArsR family regulator